MRLESILLHIQDCKESIKASRLWTHASYVTEMIPPSKEAPLAHTGATPSHQTQQVFLVVGVFVAFKIEAKDFLHTCNAL